MKVYPFEYYLRGVVLHAQLKINPNCFAMYQPPYLTIAHFDDSSGLVILADTRVEDDYTIAFSELYSQMNELLTGKRNPLEEK